jgi:hypothetical protein
MFIMKFILTLFSLVTLVACRGVMADSTEPKDLKVNGAMTAPLAPASRAAASSAGVLQSPENLLTKCPELLEIKSGATVLEATGVVTKNYRLYRKCAEQVDQWIEWYKSQKPKG